MTHARLLLQIALTLYLTGCLLYGYSSEASNSPDIDDAAILAFLEDPDSIEGILGEPGTVYPEAGIEEPPMFFISGSATGGTGYSNNFLKKNENLVSSNYLQIEMDTFLAWIKESQEFTFLAFAEASFYDFEDPSANGTGSSEIPSDEVMGFAHAKGKWSTGNFDLGVEGSIVYASFIYDSSIPGVDASAGTQIRQVSPTTYLYVDWYAPGANRIRIGISGARVDLNLINQDYWEPSLNSELEHVWSKTLRTTSTVTFTRQLYDDDYPKDQKGDPVNSDESLVVNRLALNQKLVWKPVTIKWLNADVSFGMAWDNEEGGLYEDMRQSWIRSRFIITNSWGQFKITGKWGEYRYDSRLNRRPDPRLGNLAQLALQTNRSLSVEYSRSLKWGLEILVRNQWNSLSSRTYRDNYSERRTELMIHWNY